MGVRAKPADRILDAAVELYSRKGIEGTTLREIVKLAGSSNSTMQALFPTKDDLMQAALRRELAKLDKVVPKPSGQLKQDLTELATNYHRFLEERPFLLYILPVVSRSESLQEVYLEEQDRTIAKLTVLWAYYSHAGSWVRDVSEYQIDELNETLGTAFIGGILGRALFKLNGQISGDFDAKVFVARFLEGYRRESTQAEPTSG